MSIKYQSRNTHLTQSAIDPTISTINPYLNLYDYMVIYYVLVIFYICDVL